MKRFAVLAFAALTLVLILSGCKDTGIQNTQTPTPSQSKAPAESAIKAGETYRYYYWNTLDEDDPFANAGTRAESLTKRRKEFQDKYGITVRYVRSTGGYDWYALPRSSAAAGEPIADIFNIGGPYVVLGTYFYNGTAGSCLLPISDYGRYASFDDSEYWDVQSQQYCTFNDKLYCAVPNGIGVETVDSHTVTLFNKDIIENAGYSSQQLYDWSTGGQWTWERFEEIATACTNQANEVYGTAIGDNVALISALIASNGGSYFTNNGTTDVFTGGSNNAIDAWHFFIKLAQKGVMEYSGATEANLFGTSKVAMLVTTISRLRVIYPYLDCEYGIINPPKGPAASDYLSEMSWFTPYSVMKGATNPAGSVQVISEYFSPEYAKNSTENRMLMESELSLFLTDQNSMDTALSITKYTSSQNYYLYQMVDDGDTQMLSYLYGNAWAFINGETTPEVFFESVSDKINSMIAASR